MAPAVARGPTGGAVTVTETVGIFGGSFNPPHVGHVLAVSYVLSTETVDRVLVVPAWDHPLGKTLAPYDHRHALCQLAFQDLRRVEVSAVERELGTTSRTLYTLRALRARHADWSLRLVIGADILDEKDRWYGWDEIVALAPPIVLGRLGYPHDDAPLAVLPGIASTEVRARVARGDGVHGLVPRAVADYIRTYELYGRSP